LDAGIVLAAFQNHAWTNVYRLVVWWEFDERISDYICEPRDINDQTQGSDDIEPKEETVFEFINDHSVQPNLSSKQNHRYGKAAVEIIISAFVEAEDSNIITDQSKNVTNDITIVTIFPSTKSLIFSLILESLLLP